MNELPDTGDSKSHGGAVGRSDFPALAAGCLFCCREGIFTFAERIMITLTRLNGQAFVINAEKIRYVEETPDTVVCCDTGEKLMVKEGMQEVIRRAIEYARLIRKPITD